MIDRRTLLATGAAALLAPLAAEAQQGRRIPTVGVLRPGSRDLHAPSIDALRQGLRDLGYVEGESIAIEYRWGGEKVETLPGLAADLVQRKVDVLFAAGPQATRAAIGASRDLPIVGTDLEGDPVESGFIASLARPGGNVTGLFLDLPALTGKWLELVREAVPRARRVAVLWDATTGPYQLRALKSAAQAGTIEVDVLEVRTGAEYEDVLRMAVRTRPDALIQLSSPLVQQASQRVAEFTARNRLPATSMYRRFAEVGGLMAYGPDLLVFFRRAATYVDKILKGAKPRDLPAEQPTKYELVINLKTAKVLGLTIPPSLLLRADHVIE